MKARRDLDAFLAFLAGLGTGAALMRWNLGPAWPPSSAPADEIQQQGAAAASLGRIHAVLGEIRGLMQSPARGMPAGGAAAPGTAPFAAGGPAPRMPNSVSPRPAEAPALGAAAPGARDPLSLGGEMSSGRVGIKDTWRIPDQIGYGRSPGFPWFGGYGRAGAALLAATGAAAAIAMLRRGGAAAAWSAAGGVVAASFWSAWLGGAPHAGPGRGTRDAGTRIDGRPGRRRGRRAVR